MPDRACTPQSHAWGSTIIGFSLAVVVASCQLGSHQAPAPSPSSVGAVPTESIPRSAASTSGARPREDREIERTDGAEDGWPSKHAAVLIDYRSYWSGNKVAHGFAFRGLHVDSDGTVWRYRYPDYGGPACDYLEIADPDARTHCLYQNSILKARLSSELLATLKRAVIHLTEASLHHDVSEYDAALTLSGSGTSEGKTILVGICSDHWAEPRQLQSKHARVIIDIFRRTRRAAGMEPPCSAGQVLNTPDELAPGLPNWMAP